MAVAELELGPEELLTTEEMSQTAVIWRRFRKHKLAVISLIFIVFLLGVALLAPVLMPYPYDQIDVPNAFASPSAAHPLGTDQLGRDVLSRLMWGTRVSLYVGIGATLLGQFFGVFMGAVSGYYGGRVDTILMRFTDFFLTLPSLPLLLVLSVILNANVEVVIVILAGLGWMGAARLVRGVVLSLREQEFIEASHAMGMGDGKIILRHMIPNSMAPIIVNVTLGIGTTIIVEAALSFLGFGVKPPIPSWGNMLNRVQDYILMNPFLAVYPGLAIFLTVLAFNFMGDGLRDALDPRLKM
ncbi:oligopeptide ABC transporter permease [Chloroflexota bacterium]